MSAVDGMLSIYRKNPARGENEKRGKFYRVLNEAPTALMIAIR